MKASDLFVRALEAEGVNVIDVPVDYADDAGLMGTEELGARGEAG